MGWAYVWDCCQASLGPDGLVSEAVGDERFVQDRGLMVSLSLSLSQAHDTTQPLTCECHNAFFHSWG